LSVRCPSLLEDEGGDEKNKESGEDRMGIRDSVFERLSFPVSVFLGGNCIFWGDGKLTKWPAHSVRFSRRLERMEEWKIKERGGREERRERKR
jgi:hypothetical protein